MTPIDALAAFAEEIAADNAADPRKQLSLTLRGEGLAIEAVLTIGDRAWKASRVINYSDIEAGGLSRLKHVAGTVKYGVGRACMASTNCRAALPDFR